MRMMRVAGLAAVSCLVALSTDVLACTVNQTPLAFGNINPLAGTQRDSAATITVTCLTSTTYTVELSPGVGGTMQQRAMLAGDALLQYNLYIDPQRTRVWGDGSGQTSVAAGQADDAGTVHTVYGAVPAQPRVRPGAYGDTVVITIRF